MLFRTVGGPLSTVYTEEEQDFDWDPAGYNPILPPELYEIVRKPAALRVDVLLANIAILAYLIVKLVQKWRSRTAANAAPVRRT